MAETSSCRKSWGYLRSLLIPIFFGFLLVMLVYTALFPSVPNLEKMQGDIAVLSIRGPIFASMEICKKIEKLAKNPSIKAVLIRIDSPGGSVSPSQEIYTEVKKLAQKKKVVVSMGSFGTSGAYYVAVPAHRIIANPATLTGSIGILMQHTEINELLGFAKISSEIIKSGRMKDAGSPLREMNPEEREYFERLMQTMHAQFRRAVLEGRKDLSEETLNEIADGRAFTGEEALKLKLIDGLGNFQDAVEVTKSLIGFKPEDEVQVVWVDSELSFWRSLITGQFIQNQISNWMSERLGVQILYQFGL